MTRNASSQSKGKVLFSDGKVLSCRAVASRGKQGAGVECLAQKEEQRSRSVPSSNGKAQ